MHLDILLKMAAKVMKEQTFPAKCRRAKTPNKDASQGHRSIQDNILRNNMRLAGVPSTEILVGERTLIHSGESSKEENKIGDPETLADTMKLYRKYRVADEKIDNKHRSMVQL
ncbi:hypothetical protein JTB14_038421 [Gonioctena quinquepunctata]|nr:hypothetical protein JTB14_038421 [Gonioctena quinquepunctata]